jgi:hypothetical protein
MTEQIVVGGSIAALVAADALAARGEPVRLLLPERGVGGGFAAIRREGRVLELGVRLLELAYEGASPTPPPLSDYRPALGAHRPYAATIDEWTRELLNGRVQEVTRPRMFFDGRIVDDLYFTTDALALREALDPVERNEIAEQARAAADETGSEAGLLDPSRTWELEELSAAAASRRNHGERFHDRFIAPIAEKVVAGGAEDVLASMRRKIWIPLFWPTTLAQACNGGDVAFRPERPFHTVTPDGCGDLVEALRGRIESAECARVETAGRLERLAPTGEDLELTFSALGAIHARRPVLGSAPVELFAAAGIEYAPRSARSVICWLEASPEDLNEEAPSLLNVVDRELPALRVSSSGRGAPGTQLLTVELRHDTPEEEIPAAAIASLQRIGLLREGSSVNVVMSAAASTFALPTRENSTCFAQAHDQLLTLDLDAEIVGGACDFGADALGEQVVQGLRAAEALSA